MTVPVLIFANFEEPFLLETDASKEGLGAILSQKQPNGHYHPVVFASRALHSGEKNYHLSKLEFLALKWVITKQFHEYLQYQPFTVQMDKNPLTDILTTPNLDAIRHRCWPMLQQYDLVIRHIMDWVSLPPAGQVSLGEYLEGKIPNKLKKPYTLHQKDFVFRQWMLYMRMTPANTQEDVGGCHTPY